MQHLRQDSNRGSEEGSKKVITRACDSCRKKKIRCEIISDDLCVQCTKSKIPCHFTPITVLKNRRRVTRDRRVEELEKRLAGLEGQLKRAEEQQFPIHLESGTPAEVQDLMIFNGRQPGHATSQVSFSPPELQDFALDYRILNVSAPFQQVPSYDVAAPNFDQEISAIGQETGIFQPLPSKEKALHLIAFFFQGVNTVHPIFDQTTFTSKFDAAYGTECIRSDPGWWAALNVVLALAYQHWDLPLSDFRENVESWGYLKNALAATNQLITRDYTLASVQALLGMAMLMMSMPHRKPAILLTSSAIKIAHSLGLHRQDKYPELSAFERAERTRVFWVAYSLDKDFSLATKQPPTQGEKDMDIDPPSESDYHPLQPGGIRHNLFYYRTRLAIIQGQIYRRLLSVRAGKQSAAERAMAAENLERTLQAWRRSVPSEIFCDYSGPALHASQSNTAGHPVYLQLLYFRSLGVIHESLPILPCYPTMETTAVRVRILAALVEYSVEARMAIRLFNATPRRKLPCVWPALHVFITASTTLLTQAISDPLYSLQVQVDLKLLEPFMNLLRLVESSGVNDQVKDMYSSTMTLFEQARMAAEHSSLVVGPRRHMEKVVEPAKESIEVFLERMERLRSGESPGLSSTPHDDS